MNDLVEITLAQPEERRAINLAVAADPMMQRRTEASSAGVDPGLFGLIFSLHEDGLRTPVRLLPRKIIAAIEDEDALAGRSQLLCKRGAPWAAADHDQVIMVGHATLHKRRQRRY